MRKYIGIILLLISLSGYSQTMSVESFKLLETDLDANTPGTSEKDQNGETAALIKVVTNQTGFTFDGGSLGIVKVKQTPGEVWVYIPRGAKKITIKHPQLGVLRDYYFSCPIEAARTYEMVLVTGSVQTIVNEDAGGQYLVMSVNPPTATVYIDDNEVTLQDGELSSFLPYGKHTYRVTDPLYTVDAGTFEIGKEKTNIKVDLSPSYGILNISTSPENGAKVFIDNNSEPLGITPFTTQKIIKGQHNFRFQKAEYETKTITHDIHGDGSTQPLVVSLTPNYASITINTPDNCELFINNENKGKGVWKGRLTEGLYRLEARRAGYLSSSQTLSVTKGEEKTVSMQSPTPIYGGLNINSTPIGASILIDGENKGTTPAIIHELLVGNHQLSLEKKGYKAKRQEIAIEKGKIFEISLALEKEVVQEKKTEEKKITSANTQYIQDEQSFSSSIPEVNAALQGIKNNAPNTADLVKTAYNKQKKNPAELIKIAKAYYANNDKDNAILFANYANEASKPKYQYAPAYILLGDIEATLGTDGGKAASYYNQAIVFDPKNSEGYKKYAMVIRKISPRQAEAKLKEMERNCPGEDANAIIGNIYMLAGDEKLAYENYKKADINKLDKEYLNEFVRACYFTGHFEDALKAAEAGLKLEPRNPTFNRLAMFSNYELKNYEAAKAYIHKYFNETDGAKFSEYDHFYTALIYQALEDKENMYIQYDKALKLVNDSSMIKRHAILKSVSDSYLKDQQFDNAIKYYNEYLACKPELNSDDMEGLAKIYSKYADADEARKPELIGKATEVYKSMGKKFPIQSIYATYMCASINNKLDKTGEKGLAKPDYQKVIDLLEGKADRDNGENTMLKYSYHYMMSNAFIYGKNKNLAKEYADKILNIDPDYAPAKQIKELK